MCHMLLGESDARTQQECLSSNVAGYAAGVGGSEHPKLAYSVVAASTGGCLVPWMSGGHGCLHLQPRQHFH